MQITCSSLWSLVCRNFICFDSAISSCLFVAFYLKWRLSVPLEVRSLMWSLLLCIPCMQRMHLFHIHHLNTHTSHTEMWKVLRTSLNGPPAVSFLEVLSLLRSWLLRLFELRFLYTIDNCLSWRVNSHLSRIVILDSIISVSSIHESQNTLEQVT